MNRGDVHEPRGVAAGASIEPEWLEFREGARRSGDASGTPGQGTSRLRPEKLVTWQHITGRFAGSISDG